MTEVAMIGVLASESGLHLHMASGGISAGFPSPAADFIDNSIDLNALLIKHPYATFYGRVKGDSMIGAGMADGDLLVIDKSLAPTDGKIAVCFIDGCFTVKRIKLGVNCCYLMPENPAYKPIRVNEENDFVIWGIVTAVIKTV